MAYWLDNLHQSHYRIDNTVCLQLKNNELATISFYKAYFKITWIQKFVI